MDDEKVLAHPTFSPWVAACSNLITPNTAVFLFQNTYIHWPYYIKEKRVF